MGKLANPKIGRERAAMADAIRNLEYNSDDTAWVTFQGFRLKLGADHDKFYSGYAVVANRGKYEFVWLYEKDGLLVHSIDSDGHIVGLTRKIQYRQVRATVLEHHKR